VGFVGPFAFVIQHLFLLVAALEADESVAALAFMDPL
jgi:hypothetical protein